MNNKFSYQTKRISKRNGKFRIIYIPNEIYNDYLKLLKPVLSEIYNKHVVYECDHAFVANRNCVTNASLHINHRYVLSIDIEDFFDSVKISHIEKYIPPEILEFVMIDGKVPQGFPTSPVVANIAMIEVDKLIINALSRSNPEINYSRYADDLTFSFSNLSEKDLIFAEVLKIFRGVGLKLNKKKTKLQDKKNGRAIITGLGVSFLTVHPTRKSLKKLRASIHQGNEESSKGLQEWILCKFPKNNEI